ncbi:MAG: DUF697 domain-containing protein [Firmicutes bacterium]|nr:DUF697 domain-containing protein [Bacillota bacterium]
MNQLGRRLGKILTILGIFLGLVFLVFLVNQFYLLYQLLKGIHPWVGSVFVGLLALALAYLLIRLVLLYIRSLPAPQLPDHPTQEDYDRYLDDMLVCLSKNRLLSRDLLTDESRSKEERVTTALDSLDREGEPIIRKHANSIFLSTTISQNGSLDAIMVLVTLVKMVWQLGQVYGTRPSLKSLGKLYLQVASLVFMARSLEDSDLIPAQLEPMIAGLVGESMASAIPGMVPMSNLIISSVMEGAINAFLTLRVGFIAQAYLGMERPKPKNVIQRQASLQAVKELGVIIKDSGKSVVTAFMDRVKRTARDTAKSWF